MRKYQLLTFLFPGLLFLAGCASIANKDDIYLLKNEMNEEFTAMKQTVQRLEDQVQELTREVDFVKKDTTNQIQNLSADVSSRLSSAETARAKDKEEMSKKINAVVDEVAGPRGSRTTATATRRPPVSPPPGAVTYTVRTGDTVSKIARQFAVTPEELMEANGMEDPNRLAIGDSLIIPKSGTAESPTAAAETPEAKPEN